MPACMANKLDEILTITKVRNGVVQVDISFLVINIIRIMALTTE